MTAFLLSLTLLIRPDQAVAHAPRPLPPREAFVCEALLRLANPEATWEDPSLKTTIETMRHAYVPLAEGRSARRLKAALRDVARDLATLPSAAFPVKQVSIGHEQIQTFLAEVATMASTCEDLHEPRAARHPFTARPRFVTGALSSLSGVGVSGAALTLGASFAAQGHALWGVLTAIAGAGCAHGVATPSLKSLWWDTLNADLLGSVEYRDPPQTTTATHRAHDFQTFTSQVLLALQSEHPRRFAWGRLRVKLPLSASDRPTRNGSPRAPTGHEVGVAVRRSGEFWFPYDARVVKVDFFFYYDVGYAQPVLLTFVRE